MNLSRLERSNQDIDIESDSIIQFAEEHWVANKTKRSRRWNGRQIKNAFQTALALATWDFNDGKDGKMLQRPKLADKHFSIVSQTSAHFDDYIGSTHQVDEDETYGVLAQRDGLRSDNVRKIDWGGRGNRRGNRRHPSTANPKLSRRRNGRNDRSRKEDSEDEEDDDGSSESGESGDRTGESDHDDAEMRALERKLQKMKRRKSSTKSNKKDTSEAEEADNYARPSRQQGKTAPKESSRSNLAPETRSRREMATTGEEYSEETSDRD